MSASTLPSSPHRARQYCILGTAGHIDHGKSSLVKALTGTDPDRLPEEQVRGMTIELGYAHLELSGPNGAPLHVGIVDVPGHERFVRTMVAGATGVDLGMLVVAVDDGVMPQTREHVDILNLLGVESGLVALSKADLAPAERIAAVRAQLVDLVAGTPLEKWPVVECSAKTGAGLNRIRATIAEQMVALPARGAGAIFRLAIDRVFTVHGRGTVVTGSVLAGSVAIGASLELMPEGIPCKVREVQTHGAAVNIAGSGQRAALNLTGMERDRIDRGMELATPGYLTATRYVDARVRVLKRRDKPVLSHQRVRVCMGTREEMATLVVIGDDQIAPGAQALVQLRFQTQVVCAFGQPFILRNETAQTTIGGGRVVRPASRRIRPRQPEESASLRAADSPEISVRFEEAIRQAGFAARSDLHLACDVGVMPADIAPLREKLRSLGRLIPFSAGLEIHKAAIEAVETRAAAFLKRHHAANPAVPGVLRDRFITWLDKRTLQAGGKIVLGRLESAGLAIAQGPYLASRDFRPALTPEDAAILERLVAEISTAKLDPPTWTALKTTANLSKQRSKMLEDIVKTESRLVMFSPQHYIARQALEEFKETVKKLGAGRRFKLAEVRDALQLNRRAVQPLLEYLDRIGFTKRVGDERILLEPDR